MTLGYSYCSTYDANNNRLTDTDPLGNTTTSTYNTRNQVLTIADALGHATTHAYDANGNLLTTKDAAGNTTTSADNSQGLRTSMTDALGHTTTYQYNGSGDLTQQTDALGHATTYTYDANGNKLSQTQTRTTASGVQTMLIGLRAAGHDRGRGVWRRRGGNRKPLPSRHREYHNLRVCGTGTPRAASRRGYPVRRHRELICARRNACWHVHCQRRAISAARKRRRRIGCPLR